MIAGIDAVLKRYMGSALEYLAGILYALRADYDDGLLIDLTELVHADLFDDFLDRAAHLLESGYKDPAAVLAGSVLEEHLRKLADKFGVPTIKQSGDPEKADTLNANLVKRVDLRQDRAEACHGLDGSSQRRGAWQLRPVQLRPCGDHGARNPRLRRASRCVGRHELRPTVERRPAVQPAHERAAVVEIGRRSASTTPRDHYWAQAGSRNQ